MRKLFFLAFVVITFHMNSQVKSDSSELSPRYFEDQFYMGITYNFLLNQPEGVNQQNLSYGLQAGFIKDIPLNQDGTLALGIGLGLALNTYYSNIRATQNGAAVLYDIADDSEDYKRSKLETHVVELPLEFRWRNSTAREYKFWRVYTGVKLGYVFDARSKFVPDNTSAISFSNPDARSIQYGVTFNFGYSSFNAHIYYSLNGLFNDDVLLNMSAIKMKPLQIGLIFYIL